MVYKTITWVGDGAEVELDKLALEGWQIHSVNSHGVVPVTKNGETSYATVSQYLLYYQSQVATESKTDRRPIGMEIK